MVRLARIVIPDFPHHVTDRGNWGEPVFFSDHDRERYLEYFKKYADKGGLEIGAYCLMDNHIHFIAVPRKEDSLARVIGVAHMRHAQLVNKDRGWKGHLWANRFFSTPLDQNHFVAAVRYVERNPVRAAMVGRAEEYRWSSARAHALGIPDPMLSNDALFGLENQVGDWSQWLTQADDRKMISHLRECTGTGRACGSDAFSKIVGRMIGRDVMKRRRGRRPLEIP